MLRSVLADALLPVLAGWERQHAQSGLTRPMFVGISGPQGCGKSTLVAAVEQHVSASGRRTVALSLDDFYHPFAEQQRVAAAHAGNALLQLRGNAGTHDVPLLIACLTALRDRRPVAVPRYDKSQHGGRGDRAGFTDINGPVDVVLLEGWMLGFEAVAADEVTPPELLPVNEALRAYAAVHAMLDYFVQVEVASIETVYAWRLQAEQEMRARNGGRGLDDDQVRDFVDRFMPAYRLYLPRLRVPPRAQGALRITLSHDRRVLGTALTPRSDSLSSMSP